MTKREAVHELSTIFGYGFYNERVDEAIDMAIEALQQEPEEDCISKALTLEILNAMANVDKDNIKVYSKVYSQIKDVPSGTQRCEKWIPVTERLPEEGLTVLIFAEGGEIEFGQREKDKWEWLAESIAGYWTEAEEVIAWMPLPKPYKESDGE